MQLYTSTRARKGVRNIPGSYFLNPFQLFRRILNVSCVTKAPSVPSVLISVAGTGKMSWIYVRSSGGCFVVVILFFGKKSLTKYRLWSGALLWRRNRCWLFFIFRCISFRSLPEGYEGCQVAEIPSRSKSCKLNQRMPVNYADDFREIFDATACIRGIAQAGLGSRLRFGRSRFQTPTRGREFFFSKSSRLGLCPA